MSTIQRRAHGNLHEKSLPLKHLQRGQHGPIGGKRAPRSATDRSFFARNAAINATASKPDSQFCMMGTRRGRPARNRWLASLPVNETFRWYRRCTRLAIASSSRRRLANVPCNQLGGAPIRTKTEPCRHSNVFPEKRQIGVGHGA